MQVGTWQGRGRDIEREAEVSKAAPPLPPAATNQGRTGETPAEESGFVFTNYNRIINPGCD